MNSFLNLLHHVLAPRSEFRSRRRRTQAARLSFDWLEERCLLTDLIVSKLSDTSVDSSPGELRTTIAHAKDGDTIKFAPGLSGTINLTAALGIITIDANVTIDGPLPHDGTITVSGQKKIPVFATNRSTTIRHLTIADAHNDSEGGAIYNRGSLVLQDSILSGNTASYGGGIYNHEGGLVKVQNSTLSGNTAKYGGAIYNRIGNTQLSVQNSHLTGNTASESGGAIFNRGNTKYPHYYYNQDVKDCVVSGNTAASGGGIYNGKGGTLDVRHSMLTGNSATSAGGAIYNRGGILGIISDEAAMGVLDCTVSGNTAPAGAGIYNVGDGGVGVQNCLVTGNHCPLGRKSAGGGVWNDGVLRVERSILTGNTATFGGAIYNHSGGYLYVRNSYLAENRAPFAGAARGIGAGGAIWNEGELRLYGSTLSGNTSIRGGGIWSYGSLSINKSTLTGNSASEDGGGVYIEFTSNLKMVDSILSGNHAGSKGGALFNLGRSYLTGTTLSGNGADRGGGIFNEDVTEFGGNGQVTVLDSTLSGNSATTGGGIGNEFTGTLTIQNSTLTGNLAVNGGALYNAASSTMRIQNATVSANKADRCGGLLIAPNPYSHYYCSLANTIIAGNTDGAGVPDILGKVDSKGHNLIGNDNGSSGLTNGVKGDLVGTATSPIKPYLAPLLDNGGPTETMLPLANSPALGRGGKPAEQRDQRGVLYPPDGPWDIGAVQVSTPGVRAVGADTGALPEIKIYDAVTGALEFDFFAFTLGFTGGVRVAVGDVNGDYVPDIIAGAGPGGAPEIRVFDGRSSALLLDFLAFEPTFTGGVFVAAADMNDDGHVDIVVGKGPGSLPEVKVFSGQDGATLSWFLAYDAAFRGGVTVAAGDVNRDCFPDLITGTATGPAHVKVFGGGDLGALLLQSFFAYDPAFLGGVFVAAGDTNGDGFTDVVTSTGAGGLPWVKVFDGSSALPLVSFFAYSPLFQGGVRIGTVDANGDGRADLLTGAGGAAHVKVFDALTLATLDNFFAYNAPFPVGVFVAGG